MLSQLSIFLLDLFVDTRRLFIFFPEHKIAVTTLVTKDNNARGATR